MTGSVPFPTNPTTTVVDTAIDGVFQAAVKVAETALIAAVPVLGNPILAFIDDEIMQYIAGLIYEQFAMAVSFEIIDYQVGGEVTDFKTTLAALKVAQKSGDQNAIKNALAAFQLACGSLTTFTGAGTPPASG